MNTVYTPAITPKQAVQPLYVTEDVGTFVEEDSAGVPLEATRYIACVGDYLDPIRRDQLPHLKRGGEELLGNHCMRRTTNRFLPRCAITPLELGGEVIAVDLRPQEGISVRPLLTYKGAPKQDSAGRLFPALQFYPFYPGEMIRDATDAGTNSRGIVEIPQLQGVEWDSGEPQAIQNAIFPVDWVPPTELRLIEEYISKVADSTTGIVRDVCGEFLQSAALFRRYAMAVIGRENSQVAQRVHPAGHVYSYTSQGRHFAAQLEVKLTPTVQESVNDQLVKALAASGNRQIDESTVAAIGVAVAEAVKQALASTQAEPAKAVKTKQPTKKVADE